MELGLGLQKPLFMAFVHPSINQCHYPGLFLSASARLLMAVGQSYALAPQWHLHSPPYGALSLDTTGILGRYGKCHCIMATKGSRLGIKWLPMEQGQM